MPHELLRAALEALDSLAELAQMLVLSPDEARARLIQRLTARVARLEALAEQRAQRGRGLSPVEEGSLAGCRAALADLRRQS